MKIRNDSRGVRGINVLVDGSPTSIEIRPGEVVEIEPVSPKDKILKALIEKRDLSIVTSDEDEGLPADAQPIQLQNGPPILPAADPKTDAKAEAKSSDKKA